MKKITIQGLGYVGLAMLTFCAGAKKNKKYLYNVVGVERKNKKGLEIVRKINSKQKPKIVKDKNFIKFYSRLVKENIILGTAGLLAFLKKFKEDLFLVNNCDILIDEDYNKIIKYHLKNNNDLTTVASQKSIKIPYGVCLLDKKNSFAGFEEKPNYDFLFNIGFYLINRNVLKTLKINQRLNMDKFILNLKKLKKKIGIYKIDFEKWQDFGSWESYLDNNKNRNYF